MDKQFLSLLTNSVSVDTLADVLNLNRIHFIACFVGAILCIYVMQLFAKGALAFAGDCAVSYAIRRTALIILALSMCWAMTYSTNKGWSPWPPDVVIICAIDLLLAGSVLVAFRRKRAMG